MLKIEFTEEEIERLHHEHLHHNHPTVRKRCEVVYLRSQGFSYQEIRRIVRLSQPTIREFLKQYQAGGIEKLMELNFYRPNSELEAHREKLKAEFEEKYQRSAGTY